MTIVAFILAALVRLPIAKANAPLWIKQSTLTRRGSLLTIVCKGDGPAEDLARRDALSKCRSTASDQANSEFVVTTVTVETEKSVGFHEEVHSQKTIKGLICDVKEEFIEENAGSFVAYLKCAFDLAKAKIINGPADEVSQVQLGENKSVYLSSIPMCESVIVRGARSRTITCKTNPTPLLIYPDDKSIIVRAEGYLPMHLELNGRGIINVQLQRN